MELTRLTGEEQALYDDLHSNNLGEKVRLEQERIGFDYLVAALGKL
ncbi:Wadjet anti-phage system protein JetD domain-containing protein [Chlorobium limicola]|nr:Wadjet anti-phage system protein JetD domain-containing protein [Chlorobium limicola]